MTLLEEIQAKCSPALIASREHGQIAAEVSVNRTRIGAISTALLSIWVAKTGLRAAIEDHAINSASPLRSIALSLKDALNGGSTVLELDNPENQAMLDAWVAAGALTSAQKQDLINRATVPAPVSVAEVVEAMKGL